MAAFAFLIVGVVCALISRVLLFTAALNISVVWAIGVFTLDAATGWNYGYLGRATPGIPTLIDHLGPWPGRVAIMIALGLSAMTLLWLPWLLIGRSSRGRYWQGPGKGR